MDSHITKEFLNKARDHIKKYEPYPEDDPIFDRYDGNKDFDRCKSTMLIQVLTELGLDPYDETDYGNITE